MQKSGHLIIFLISKQASISIALDFQDQIFNETVGKILTLKDEKEHEDQYEKGFIHAFKLLIEFVQEYAKQKKRT